MYKTIEKYFKNHTMYNSFVHAVGGVGVGILITYPLIGEHPIRWGVGLLALSILGHLYAAYTKN